MKAIYRGKLYHVIDDVNDDLLLEGMKDGIIPKFWVGYSDPDLLIDPTDAEISYLIEGEDW